MLISEKVHQASIDLYGMNREQIPEIVPPLSFLKQRANWIIAKVVE